MLIDIFPERDELDLKAVQLVENIEEVLHRLLREHRPRATVWPAGAGNGPNRGRTEICIQCSETDKIEDIRCLRTGDAQTPPA